MTRRSIPWRYEQHQQLKHLWFKGSSISFIAQSLGVSETSVKKLRIADGLPKRRHSMGRFTKEINVRFTSSQWATIEALAEENGFTTAKIVRLAIERFTGKRDDE